MTEARGELTAERLRELLSYDPETGVFTWRVNRRRWKAGQMAGTIVEKGYIRIRVDDGFTLLIGWRFSTSLAHGQPIRWITSTGLRLTTASRTFVSARRARMPETGSVAAAALQI
jgi:hypothetical protein